MAPTRDLKLEEHSVNFINLRRWSGGAVINLLDNLKSIVGGKTIGEQVFKLTSGWHFLIQRGIQSQHNSEKRNSDAVKLWEQVAEEIEKESQSHPLETINK